MEHLNTEKNSDMIRLRPVFTHNVWGGTKLREEFGYAVEGDDVGECWGVAAHDNGDCAVAEGRFRGMTLAQLWREHRELFGGIEGERFPLLVKIIDAKDDLSIQVHPDDAYAAKHENGSLGKMECWYILDCSDGASLVVGHNARTREELARMIDGGEWSALIREIPVEKGDFIQIDPGTVHAIKGGITLLETQQNSDVTYRLYDYDRLSGGKKRPIHIAQSLDVITVPARPKEESVVRIRRGSLNTPERLIACRYYQVFALTVSGEAVWEQTYPFLIVSVTEGSGSLNGEPLKKGDHFILPYAYGSMRFAGDMQLIASTVNGV